MWSQVEATFLSVSDCKSGRSCQSETFLYSAISQRVFLYTGQGGVCGLGNREQYVAPVVKGSVLFRSEKPI